MPYGSTKIRAAEDYCPRAIDYIDAGTPTHREHFGVGTACHVALEQLQLEANKLSTDLTPDDTSRVLGEVWAALVAGGRQWRGTEDPPLSPSVVDQGIELAAAWHARYGTLPDARAELGVGVNVAQDDLHLVPYNETPNAGYRTSLDLVYLEHQVGEDGDPGYTLVVARDYKTGWNAGDAMLHGSQMRAQAVLALMWAESQGHEVSGVRIEIGAIRSGKVHARTLYRVDDQVELEDWRADLVATVRGLEGQRTGRNRQRPAVPSLRCGGCPYLHACQDGRKFLSATNSDPVGMAAQLVAVETLRSHLLHRLKEQLAEGDTIEVDGWRVGHVGRTTRALHEDAPGVMAELWGAGQAWCHDAVVGLLRAAKLGPTQAEAVAKALAPGRGDKARRDGLVEEWTTTKTSGAFGVRRAAGEEDDA